MSDAVITEKQMQDAIDSVFPNVCYVCIRIHKRDTTHPIQCPKCKKIIGCFWHNKNIKHIRNCK